jgi:hypothetical protein
MEVAAPADDHLLGSSSRDVQRPSVDAGAQTCGACTPAQLKVDRKEQKHP